MNTDQVELGAAPVRVNVRIWKFVSATGRDQWNRAGSAHLVAHLLRPIAPPVRDRGDVVVEVALALVLDVEGVDVRRELRPLFVSEKPVPVVHNVLHAQVKVPDGGRVLVPPDDVVGACRRRVAVDRGEFVLFDVCI